MSDSIERINTSFTDFLKSPQAKVKSKPYNHFTGGHKITNGPFVSGYWYFLLELPENIVNGSSESVNNLFSMNKNSQKYLKKYLHGTAESFTPPSKTINKGEISGFGGIKKYVALNQSITPNFSVSFYELSGMPIHKIFKIWSNVFNSNYGYRKTSVYKSSAYAFLCKPTWSHTNRLSIAESDVEEMFYFEGVFPETDGNDALASNISENSLVQYQIQFSFDSYYLGADNSDILTLGVKTLREVVGEVPYKIEDIMP